MQLKTDDNHGAALLFLVQRMNDVLRLCIAGKDIFMHSLFFLDMVSVPRRRVKTTQKKTCCSLFFDGCETKWRGNQATAETEIDRQSHRATGGKGIAEIKRPR